MNTVAAVNEIILSWSSAGPSVSYEVEWRSGPVEDSAQVSDGSTSYTISGLEAESTYTISVTAENDAGSSESEPVPVNTGKRSLIRESVDTLCRDDANIGVHMKADLLVNAILFQCLSTQQHSCTRS